MVRNARHTPVRVARAALSVRALEAPFDLHVARVRRELRDEVLLGKGRVRRGTVLRAECFDTAIGAGHVVVVLGDDRVGPIMLVYAGRIVPPEAEVAYELPGRTEVHQFAL